MGGQGVTMSFKNHMKELFLALRHGMNIQWNRMKPCQDTLMVSGAFQLSGVVVTFWPLVIKPGNQCMAIPCNPQAPVKAEILIDLVILCLNDNEEPP